jgi:hypothetical protein
MNNPRFLRFTRALSLLGGAGLTACGAPSVSVDAAPTDVARVEASALDTGTTAPEAGSAEDVARADSTVDVREPPADVLAVDANRDAVEPRADTGTDGAARDAGLTEDVAVMDAGGCPAAPPRNGTPCGTPDENCSWSDPSMVTFCTCTAGAWSCATAVPGPLPPPELSDDLDAESVRFA